MPPVGLSFGSRARPNAPPPSELSASNVGLSGGSGVIRGSNFVGGCTAWIVISGSNISLTITFVDTTKLTYVLAAGTYAAGTYSLWVKNPDGQFDVQPIFIVTPTSDPVVVFGAAVGGWWRSDFGLTLAGVAATNGGKIDKWADKTANGIDITGTGTARPTYNSSCSYSSLFPSVSFDGVANLLKNTSMNINASTDFTLFIVLKETGTNTNKIWAMWGSNSGASPGRWAIGNSSGKPANYASVGASAIWASTPSGGFQAYTGFHGTSGSYTTNISIANAPTVTASSAQTWSAPTTGTVSAGGATDGSSFTSIEVVEFFIVVGHNPTVAEYKAIATYLNLRYFNTAPGFTTSTIMLNTGTGFRIKGSGFVGGVTVSFNGGLGVADQTGTLVSTSIVEVPMPGTSLTPGSYSITITNPDGGTVTTDNNGLVITSSASATPMTATGDLSCVGWYDLLNASFYTLNGSSVSGLLDQSLRGNDMLQATAVNQPPMNTNDVNFNNISSWTFNGTTNYLATAANMDLAASATTFTTFSVTWIDATNPTGDFIGGGAGYGMSSTSGKPTTFYGGNAATWGTAVGGVVKSIYTNMILVTNLTISVDVNNSGSPATATSSPSNTGHIAYLGCYNAAAFGKGKQTVVAIYNRALTPTEQSNLRSMATAHYGA